jgi:hypothetical protein
MRDKRNQLLKDSDFRVLPDYVLDKDLWIIYRQKLRELPATWVKGFEIFTTSYVKYISNIYGKE